MPKNYTPFNIHIKNTADNEAVIDVDDIIGNEWTDATVTRKALRRKLSDLKELNGKVDKVRVNISTYGGDVADGLAMYDMLKELDAEVTTVVRGLTASAGTIIAQAATPGKRLQSDNSAQLVHAAWTFTYGNADDLRAEADDLDRITDRIVNIYAKNGADKDKVIALMKERDRWMLPEEALELGLIDQVYMPEEEQEKEAVAEALRKANSELFEKMPFNAPNMEVTMKANGDVVYKLLKNAPEEQTTTQEKEEEQINTEALLSTLNTGTTSTSISTVNNSYTNTVTVHSGTVSQITLQTNQDEEQPHILEQKQLLKLKQARAIAQSRKTKTIEESYNG